VQKFYNKALAGGQREYAKLYASIFLDFFTHLSSRQALIFHLLSPADKHKKILDLSR
jgi:hypothetical protein